MNKKLLYSAPEAIALVVQSEGVVCSSLNDVDGVTITDGVLDDWTDGGSLLL